MSRYNCNFVTSCFCVCPFLRRVQTKHRATWNSWPSSKTHVSNWQILTPRIFRLCCLRSSISFVLIVVTSYLFLFPFSGKVQTKLNDTLVICSFYRRVQIKRRAIWNSWPFSKTHVLNWPILIPRISHPCCLRSSISFIFTVITSCLL